MDLEIFPFPIGSSARATKSLLSPLFLQIFLPHPLSPARRAVQAGGPLLAKEREREFLVVAPNYFLLLLLFDFSKLSFLDPRPVFRKDNQTPLLPKVHSLLPIGEPDPK